MGAWALDDPKSTRSSIRRGCCKPCTSYVTKTETVLESLNGADLSDADLGDANLGGADLSGATGVTDEQLAEAGTLEGATMPNGSKHD